MATIKISQLPNVAGNLTGNALLPIVSTNGVFTTDKVTVNQLANYILVNSGNLLANANISLLAYDVINAAQPNITSVGTLTSLNVSGTSNLGYPASVKVLGGNAGQVLSTNGTGNLSWIDQIGATGATGPVGDRYQTISTSNLTIALGNISLEVEPNLAYTVGQDISVNYDVNNYMAGPVITYDSVTGNLEFQSITINGSGTYDDWTVNLDGAAGGIGATGSTGPVGATGAGATGATGLTGATGVAGTNGSDGATGATGVAGVDGATGATGPAGTNGTDGATGATGVAGVDGATGATGPAGTNGTDGATGATGVAGVDGATGATGLTGATGVFSGEVTSNLLPNANITYDLGNNTNRFKDIYLANSTIYLGDATLSANGNSIVVDSITVTNGDVGTIGNIAGINLDGSSSNVLYGNGTFAPVSNPFDQDLNTTDNVEFANVTSTEAIRFSNSGNIVGALGAAPTYVSIESYGSNSVYITTNDFNTWAFNSDGTLSFPGNVAGAAGNVLIDSADDNFEVRGAQAVNFEANTVVNIYTDTSNAAYQWQFGDDGNLTLPTNTSSINYANGSPYGVGGANLGNLQVNGTTLEIANGASQTTLTIGNGPAGLTMNQDSGSDAYLRLSANTTGGEYYSAGNEYSTGDYVSGGIGGVITLYGATTIETFLNNLSFPGQIVSLTINGTDTVPYDGGGWGGGTVTLNTTTPPSVDPTVVTSITLNIVYVNQFVLDNDEGDWGIYLGDENLRLNSGRDVRIDAGDDFSAESVDSFELRSRSTEGGIELITDYGNSNQTWFFGYDGNLTLPNNAKISISGTTTQFNTCPNGFLGLNSYDAGSNNIARVNISSIDQLVSIGLSDPITEIDYNWTFDITGNLTLPGNSFAVNYANGTQVPLGGGGLPLANGTSNIDIAAANGNITITSNGTHTWTFDTGGILSKSDANGLVIAANYSAQIITDYGDNDRTWTFDGSSGELVLPGGNVLIDPTDDNFEVRGAENINFEANAVVNIYTDDGNYQWQFGDDGNLIFPGTGVISNPANSSLDPVNPNVSTMILTPDSGYSAQSLVLDPTAPGHIHIRVPSYDSNIDHPVANIFLGGEVSSFEVGYSPNANSAPNVYIHSDSNTWTFSTDGIITLPGEGILQSIDDTVTLRSKDSSSNVVNGIYVGTSGGLGFFDSSIPGNWLEIFRLGVDPQIATIGNLLITSDSPNTAPTWNFDNTGNLTLPGGGTIFGNPYTPSGAPGNTITLQPAGSGTITDQRLLIYPTAGDGDHIHMVTGNLYQTELFLGSDNFFAKLANTGNFVIQTNDNVGNVAVYTFGYNGDLSLPGNLVGSGASPSPTISGFDSISLNGTGTVVNASAGNILTNEVTGTKFNFLNGLYTATLTGSGATSNYSLNLPANAGSNGQILRTDGTGNLSWSNVAVVGSSTIVFNNVVGGASNWTGTYNSSGGRLLVTVYVTGYAAVSNTYTYSLRKNGSNVATSSVFISSSTISTHLVLPPINYIDTSGDIGSATWSIVFGSGLGSNDGDYATITVVETTGITNPAFSAYNSSAVGLTTSGTKVTYTTEEFDTNNNYDTSTSRYTPTVAGYYQVTVSTMIPNTSVLVSSMIYKNGTKIADGPGGAGGGFFYGSSIASKLVYMNGTTDYLEGYAITSSNVNTYNSNTSTYFQAYMVRGV